MQTISKDAAKLVSESEKFTSCYAATVFRWLNKLNPFEDQPLFIKFFNSNEQLDDWFNEVQQFVDNGNCEFTTDVLVFKNQNGKADYVGTETF